MGGFMEKIRFCDCCQGSIPDETPSYRKRDEDYCEECWSYFKEMEDSGSDLLFQEDIIEEDGLNADLYSSRSCTTDQTSSPLAEVKAAGRVFVGVVIMGMTILGLVIHVWTIVIAFTASGLFGAVIALALPVIAEVIWFFKVWEATDSVSNKYCISILIYVGLWIAAIVGRIVTADD
jgi:hypothetical protein